MALAVVGLLIIIGDPGDGWAASPEIMSHQGLLILPDGQVAPDGLYEMRFRICDSPAGGCVPAVWEQTLANVQIQRGLYNVLLSAPGLADAFSTSNTWFEIALLSAPGGVPIDPGGTTLTPRQQIGSVPYALSTLSEAQVKTWATESVKQGVTIEVDDVGSQLCTDECWVLCSSPGAIPIACSFRKNESEDTGEDSIGCFPDIGNSRCTFRRDITESPDSISLYCTCLNPQ